MTEALNYDFVEHCRQADLELVKYCVSLGADVSYKGYSCLVAALDHIDVLRYLVEEAGADLYACNSRVLIRAVRTNSPALSYLLTHMNMTPTILGLAFSQNAQTLHTAMSATSDENIVSAAKNIPERLQLAQDFITARKEKAMLDNLAPNTQNTVITNKKL